MGRLFGNNTDRRKNIKVVLTGYIKVPVSELESVKQHLNSHVASTRDEPGCIEFDVEQREENPCIFDVYEEFEDSNSFIAHQERTKNSVWAEVTKNVERVYRIDGLKSPLP